PVPARRPPPAGGSAPARRHEGGGRAPAPPGRGDPGRAGGAASPGGRAMKRAILGAAVAIATVLVNGATAAEASPAPTSVSAAGRIDPAVHAELVAAAPRQLVRALVVLQAQANLSGIRTTLRSQRLAAVERSLRAHASASQRGVLALLDKRRAQRLVSDVVPLRIVN